MEEEIIPEPKWLKKFKVFDTHREQKIKKRNTLQRNSEIVRKELLPEVVGRFIREGGFFPIPGRPGELFESILENKLGSIDRKNLRHDERVKIAIPIQKEREKQFAYAHKFLSREYNVFTIRGLFSGSSYALPEEYFTFTEDVLFRGELKERKFSFPDVYYGINSIQEYWKEFSTITNWEDSKVSWCLSEGFENPVGFSVFTDIEPSPQFFHDFALIAETAKRLAGKVWFFAAFEAIERFKYRVSLPKYGPLRYPPKPIVREQYSPGIRTEIFGKIYEIKATSFIQYFDILISSPIKFIQFNAFMLERPELDPEEVLSFLLSEISVPAFSGGAVRIPFDDLLEYDRVFSSEVCNHKPRCPTMRHPFGDLNGKFKPRMVRPDRDSTARPWLPSAFIERASICQLNKKYGRFAITQELSAWIARELSEEEREALYPYLRPPDVQRIKSAVVAISGAGLGHIRDQFTWMHVSQHLSGRTKEEEKRILRSKNFSEDFPKFVEKVIHLDPKKAERWDLRYATNRLESIASNQSSYSLGGSLFSFHSYKNGEEIITPTINEERDPTFDLVPDQESFDIDVRVFDEYTSDIRFWAGQLIFRRGIG